MHVRVWLHETSFREQRCARYNFFLMLTKTGTAMAVLAVVAATALNYHIQVAFFNQLYKQYDCK